MVMEPMRDSTELKRFLESARRDFLVCRVWQHQWPEFGSVEEKSGIELVWTKICLRCGTEKHLHIRKATGEYLYATYGYPYGYLIPGGYGLDSKERGMLRLELIQRGG